jgi:TetR/AcrR family transcriptional repressor of nem operon
MKPTGRYVALAMKASEEILGSKERLMQAALQLMKAKGFPATTIDEICEKVGVTKGCFFHHFEGKEELGKLLVEHAANQQIAFLKEEADPLKRIYALIDFYITPREGELEGCILGTFAQELSETYPEIREACEKGFADWANALAKDFDAAKALYPPKFPFNSLELAYYFISLLEGSLLLAKVQKNAFFLQENMRRFKKYLQSIFDM